jgi:hypothetical protein
VACHGAHRPPGSKGRADCPDKATGRGHPCPRPASALPIEVVAQDLRLSLCLSDDAHNQRDGEPGL